MRRMPDPLQMLAHGVPVTLLLDLLDESGPNSRRLYDEEPADTGWVPQRLPRAS